MYAFVKPKPFFRCANTVTHSKYLTGNVKKSDQHELPKYNFGDVKYDLRKIMQPISSGMIEKEIKTFISKNNGEYNKILNQNNQNISNREYIKYATVFKDIIKIKNVENTIAFVGLQALAIVADHHYHTSYQHTSIPFYLTILWQTSSFYLIGMLTYGYKFSRATEKYYHEFIDKNIKETH